MEGKTTLADKGLGDDCETRRQARLGLLSTFAKGLRQILQRSGTRQDERRIATGRQDAIHARVEEQCYPRASSFGRMI
jgi:hypothetical protein